MTVKVLANFQQNYGGWKITCHFLRCLLGLPLLPTHDIVGALQDICITIATDGSQQSSSATAGVRKAPVT